MEEFGDNGYWKRTTIMRGTSPDGTVDWEEQWWTISDFLGMKELGAHKAGQGVGGARWHETWSEKVQHIPDKPLMLQVQRYAHKWARDTEGDEWEEKWGENYRQDGPVNKYANKWAKKDNNVWHESWGEDYDGRGGCHKWTDKYAERMHLDGAREQWGDKWNETFANGQGSKTGEVWSVDGGGHRYQRWWGEDHYGNKAVRLYGHSTTGEQWDHVNHMDTYYNPIPHFTFKMALDHSPELLRVQQLRRNFSGTAAPQTAAGNGGGGGGGDDDDGLGAGLAGLD